MSNLGKAVVFGFGAGIGGHAAKVASQQTQAIYMRSVCALVTRHATQFLRRRALLDA